MTRSGLPFRVPKEKENLDWMALPSIISGKREAGPRPEWELFPWRLAV